MRLSLVEASSVNNNDSSTGVVLFWQVTDASQLQGALVLLSKVI
jgi:hypothetical protein